MTTKSFFSIAQKPFFYSGATVLNPVEDKFYGHRNGQLLDPFGHSWDITTPIEEVSPQEMQKRFTDLFKE